MRRRRDFLMRFLFAILFLALGLGAGVEGATTSTIITATVTVTNAPTTNGMSITVNGNTRTWTNNTAAAPSSYILTNAAIGGVATNLYNHIAAYRYSSPLVELRRSGTNAIVLVGQTDQALAVSVSGTWASVVLATNAVGTNTFVPKFPMQDTSDSTNTASIALRDLTLKSTNLVSASAPSMANFVSAAGNNNVTGANVFSNATQQFVGGTVDGVVLTNITGLYAAGDLVIDADTVVAGDLWVTNASPNVWWWQTDGGLNEKITTWFANGTTFSLLNVADGFGSSATAVRLTRSGITPTLMEVLSPFTPSYILNSGWTNMSGTNSTFTATNIFTGDISFTRANHTSLANGNNAAVDLGTKVLVKIKAGPTAAFAICGIAGGRDGRRYLIYNATGQNMTIANDSGLEPTAANRIYTNTGADVVTTGNGAAEVYYDTEDSRWVVANLQL